MEPKSYFSIARCYGINESDEKILQIPVSIGPDTLPDELEMCLNIVGKHNFISYKMVSVMELLINLITDKLRAYASLYPEEAKVAGKRMIAILEAVDTDDDTFPEFNIALIQKIIGK